MNVYLSSLAYVSVGAYATISGYRDLQSQDKSNGWGVAKTALGVAILASQADFALTGSGLVDRIFNSFATSKFDPTQCDLDQAKQILKSLEVGEIGKNMEDRGLSHIFQVLKNTKGMTCENYLPWPNDAMPKGVYDIRPEHLDQSVMWGMDPAKKLFVAIKNGCVSEGFLTRLSIYAQRAGETADKGSCHSDRCMPRLIASNAHKWLTELFRDGSAQVPFSALSSWPCGLMPCAGLFENVRLA